MSLQLDEYISWAAAQGASDLFLKANAAPAVRVHGSIATTDFPVMSAAQVKELCNTKMNARQQARSVKMSASA